MYARYLPLVALVFGCDASLNSQNPDYNAFDDYAGSEYDYVLGYDDDRAESITGGAHHVVDWGTHYREGFGVQNATTKVHPDLKGSYLKLDRGLKDGESDFDVFASSWWSQKENGIARRWTGGSNDYSLHDNKDALSAVEKYDLLFNPGQDKEVAEVEHWDYAEIKKDEADRGEKHKHPAVKALGPATKWELKNHGTYQNGYHPEGWWGHCNGWASYVTTEKEGKPARDIRVKIIDDKVTECTHDDAECVLVRMGDIEALLSELYFNDQATFGGQRCKQSADEMERDEYGRPTDPKCRDINAGTFHVTITGLLGTGAEHLGTGEDSHPPFIIDHSYDYEVWNYPVTKFQVHDYVDVTPEEAAELIGASEYSFNQAATKFVRVMMTYWMVSDGVSMDKMLLHADDRNIDLHPVRLHYVLEMNDDETILGGEWIQDPETSVGSGNDSKKLHPDFVWIGTDHRGYSESADDSGGDNDNPYVRYPDVKALLACSNDPATCAPPVQPAGNPDPASPALTCEDSCGEEVTLGDESCWCDDVCVNYGDCCEDRADYCEAAPEPEPEPEPAPAAPTCANHCGSSDAAPGSDPACYCDSVCGDYGDCCADKVQECGA